MLSYHAAVSQHPSILQDWRLDIRLLSGVGVKVSYEVEHELEGEVAGYGRMSQQGVRRILIRSLT